MAKCRNGSWTALRWSQGTVLLGGTAVPDSWHIAGLGDFGGDGKSDILWRSDSGQVSEWIMDGTTVVAGTVLLGGTAVPDNWHIAGVGDFGGDGKSDILWRNDDGQVSEWIMDGTTVVAGTVLLGGTAVPSNWHIAGVGDFGGDGKSDILWRSDSGQVSEWIMDGTTVVAGTVLLGGTAVPDSWHIANVGDFSGDGKSDILWRNDNGQVSEWIMDGTTVVAGTVLLGGAPVPNDWIVNPT